MATRSSCLILLLITACTACTPYATTVVMQDGSRVEGIPRCTVGAEGNKRLVGDGMEEGIPDAQIASLRSHAGLEPMVVGAVLLAGGVALVVHGVKSNQEGWIATGGVVGGISLIQTVIGAVFFGISTSARNRACSHRSPWYFEP